MSEKARTFVTQARKRATELREALPKAQLGGSYAADVMATLRSLEANLESAAAELEPPAPATP